MKTFKFGAIVRRHRTELKLTIQKLADIVGVSSIYITQIERGYKIPLPPVTMKIAIALKKDPSMYVMEALSEKYPSVKQLWEDHLEKLMAEEDSAEDR